MLAGQGISSDSFPGFVQTLEKNTAERERATQLLAVGVTPGDASIDPVTLASMSRVAALAMNTPDAYSIR